MKILHITEFPLPTTFMPFLFSCKIAGLLGIQFVTCQIRHSASRRFRKQTHIKLARQSVPVIHVHLATSLTRKPVRVDILLLEVCISEHICSQTCPTVPYSSHSKRNFANNFICQRVQCSFRLQGLMGVAI